MVGRKDGKKSIFVKNTYLSAEDSELIRLATKTTQGSSCLEIGFGYGSNLLELLEHFTTIVGTEIMKTDGLPRLKGIEGVHPVLTDGASCFRDGVFDLVFMNPPYLPSNANDDLSTDGGKNGFEVAASFLEDAIRVLHDHGKILLLLSSETSFDDFSKFCENKGLSFRPILSRALFFESLTVYEMRKKIKVR